jgi:hypothetical protein
MAMAVFCPWETSHQDFSVTIVPEEMFIVVPRKMLNR